MDLVKPRSSIATVAIELLVVQFWSEVILVISNHAYDFRPNCTPLSSITIINLFAKVAEKEVAREKAEEEAQEKRKQANAERKAAKKVEQKKAKMEMKKRKVVFLKRTKVEQVWKVDKIIHTRLDLEK